jgi:GxxExxY protein
MAELVLKDEVYAIVGAAIEVHKVLGSAFLEAVYQEAMELELALRGTLFDRQKPLPIRYKRWVLNKFYVADLICYGQVLVELKATDRLTSKDEAQLLNYLAATGLRVGLLSNFGAVGKLEWKRLVN